MKLIKKLIFFELILLSISPVYSASIFDPPYKKLAENILATVNENEKNMIAVISFHSLDNDDSGEGDLISEEIIYELIKNGKVHVVERKQISSIMDELQFNQSGAIDAAAAKRIGNGLGADVLVIGNYTTINERELKIYAKVVDTETFKVLGAHQQVVKRIKLDKEAAAQKKARREAMWSKFDLVLMTGLAIPGNNASGTFTETTSEFLTSTDTTTTFENIQLEASVPVVLRTNFWFNKVFGAGVDIGYTYLKFSPQTFNTSSSTIPYEITQNEYYQLNHYYIGLNFLIRIPIDPKIHPFAGIGYKFSFQSISYTGTQTDFLDPISNQELGVDFGYRPDVGSIDTILNLFTYIVGAEWFITDAFGIMVEYQYINFGETKYLILNLFNSSSNYDLTIDPVSTHILHVAAIFKF